MYQWIAKVIGKITARPVHAICARKLPGSTAAHEGAARAGAAIKGAAFEGLEDRRLMSSSISRSIDLATVSSSNYNTTLNMLHDTGTHSVRMWVNVNSFNSRGEDGSFKYIRKLHGAGIDITLSVVPRSGLRGSYGQVQSYFNWLDGTLGGSVDRWEIGNEVDKSYGGSLNSYVNDLLKPAAAALHSHGEKVISGSVSWNPDDIKTMVNDGMLNYVDYVGYHPYRSNLADLEKCVGLVKSYIGGKPLIATEWSPRGQSTADNWNAMIKAFWPVIRDNFYGSYYYAAFKSGSMAGGGGIMTGGGGHNGAFYDTYKNLGSGGNGSISVPPAPVVSTSTAQKASTATKITAAVKPVVSAFRLLDAKTGNVLKGFDNITSSETINLKSLPTRYIQVEAVTSNVNSLKFTFTGRNTRVENYAPFTAFANSVGAAEGWNAGAGSFTLTATAYSGRFAAGTTGNKLGVVLTFR